MSNVARMSSMVFTAALTLSTGCVRHQPNVEPAPIELSAPSDFAPSDRVAAAELQTVKGVSAADAIRQLRPHFLHGGPRNGSGVAPTPAVYVNGQHVGGVDALEIIGIGMVIEVRHLDAIAAKSMFGSYCHCERGVILVQMRRTAQGG